MWQSLSDLFLDTELSATDIKHIADNIRRAGFSANEAEEILRTEVAPVFWTNLCKPAGEWAPWSKEQVCELVCEKLRTRPRTRLFSWFYNWISRRQMSLVKSDWLRVRACLEKEPFT